MKTKYNILILFSCLIFYSNNIISQSTNCGAFYFESFENSLDANYSVRTQAFEANLQDSIIKHHFDSLSARVTDVSFGVTRIPVVVHILGNSASSMVNYFMVSQVINDLNDLFRKKSQTPGFGAGVDTEIEFCLAIKDQTGFSISGVDIISDGSHGPYGPYSMTDANDIEIKSSSNTTPTRWGPDKYLNIWVCDLTNATEKVWGSAPTLYLPVSSKKYRDGVVIDMNNFNAKLLAHGIGHWLNLRHTYGDIGSSCGSTSGTLINSDFCSDTPWCLGSNNAIGSTGFCTPKPQQCITYNSAPNLDRQIENYMDDSQASCMNMFTLQQKNRMQALFSAGRTQLALNSIASCVPQPSCNDNIQNGQETGIDCGGPSCIACPGCSLTVNFKINGHSTNWWETVNVCNSYGGIMLSPYSSNCPGPPYTWYYTSVYFQGNTSPAVNGGGPLGNSFAHMFISIQECDIDRNPIGAESGTYFNISPHIHDALNLHDFLYYLGNPLSAGKYFRILTEAGTNNQKRTHIAFIKVFEPNVSLSNLTVNNSQVGDNISIVNSSVASPINVVASNAIEVLPNSSLTSGSYFINTIDCNNISGFRSDNNDNSQIVGSLDNSIISNSFGIQNNESKSDVKIEKIKIIPNPNSGNFNISYDEKSGTISYIEILNSIGVSVQKIDNVGSISTIPINIQNEPSGLYVVRINYNGKTITKKIIKN